MTILIVLGENGMLGNYIKKYFETRTNMVVIGIGRTKFDVFTDNISILENILAKYLCADTVIINCIGIIPQSVGTNSNHVLSQYQKINTEFPHKLSELCDQYGMRLIHASTDCVFTGKKGSYVETDCHDEVTAYGQSKSKGEPANQTVIRTSIIGEEINHFRSLVEWTKHNAGAEINGYANHYWNGITCLQYAKIVEIIINNNYFWKGVRHIYSPTTMSKYDLVSMINDIYNLSIKINKFDTDTSVDKSLSTVYEENGLFDIPELYDQIKEMKEFSTVIYSKVI